MYPIIGTICRLIYEIPLIFLQLRVSYVLIRNRTTFSSTFHRLLIFNNTTCILLWLCVQFVNNYQSWCSIFTSLPLLNDNQLFTTFILYSLKSFCFSWLICGVFLGLNRLSYFVYQYDKEKVWSRLFFVILLIAIIGPRLIFYNETKLASRFVINNNSLLFFYGVEYLDSWPISAYQAKTSSIVELLFLITIIITLISLVFLQTRQPSSISVRVIQGANRKFIWFCIADFSIHFIWLLNDAILFFVENECMRSVIMIIYLFLKEFILCLYGAILVIFDVKLRKIVFGTQVKENLLSSIN